MTTSAAEGWPDACATCGRRYSKDDSSSSHCSNAFHLCRDCTWEEGILVDVCRDHDVEPPPGETWAPCSVCGTTQVPAGEGLDTCSACASEAERKTAAGMLTRLDAAMRKAALEAQRHGGGVAYAVVGGWVRQVEEALEALGRESAASRQGFKAMADATRFFAARARQDKEESEKNWRKFFTALDGFVEAKQALEDYGQHLVGTGPEGPCPKATSHDPGAACNCGLDGVLEALAALRERMK